MTRARILADYVSGGTTANEFDALDGIDSNIQAQLDAKVSNATHTGDVTGATALTIATDAVDIAMLSATGTASGSTFLRGDNAWATAGGGKLLQVATDTYNSEPAKSNSAYEAIDSTNFQVTMTGIASTSSKFLIMVTIMGLDASDWGYFDIYREITGGATTLNISGNAAGLLAEYNGHLNDSTRSYHWLDAPSTTSNIKYAPSAGTIYGGGRTWNINDSGGLSTITVMEISS